jgi:hypothetical protein
MSVTGTQSPMVLEQASQDFVEATAAPPFLYELTPAEARKVLGGDPPSPSADRPGVLHDELSDDPVLASSVLTLRRCRSSIGVPYVAKRRCRGGTGDLLPRRRLEGTAHESAGPPRELEHPSSLDGVVVFMREELGRRWHPGDTRAGRSIYAARRRALLPPRLG